jgi:hypothetical protein
MDYGIIISLIIFSNCAFITLLFTRFDLEVIINNLKAMVGVIYRPPHSDVSYWRKFENNIQPILDLNIPVILGGDLNIDMLGKTVRIKFI